MPTKTFINLPKDKRARILKAARKEFSRVPLEKAVIANIVKSAKIPRGSFYQYFTDVEDLFVYLVKCIYGIDKKEFKNYLLEADNDVYEALKIRFSKMIDRLTIVENKQFQLNIMTTVFGDMTADDIISKKISEQDNLLNIEFFPENVRKSSNSSKLIGLLKMVYKNCVVSYLTNNTDEQEIKAEYNRYIDFLKHGLN